MSTSNSSSRSSSSVPLSLSVSSSSEPEVYSSKRSTDVLKRWSSSGLLRYASARDGRDWWLWKMASSALALSRINGICRSRLLLRFSSVHRLQPLGRSASTMMSPGSELFAASQPARMSLTTRMDTRPAPTAASTSARVWGSLSTMRIDVLALATLALT